MKQLDVYIQYLRLLKFVKYEAMELIALYEHAVSTHIKGR